MEGNPLKKFVSKNVAAKVPPDNPACPLNGRDVFRALTPHNVIVLEVEVGEIKAAEREAALSTVGEAVELMSPRSSSSRKSAKCPPGTPGESKTPRPGRRLRSCAPSAPRGRRESSPIP